MHLLKNSKAQTRLLLDFIVSQYFRHLAFQKRQAVFWLTFQRSFGRFVSFTATNTNGRNSESENCWSMGLTAVIMSLTYLLLALLWRRSWNFGSWSLYFYHINVLASWKCTISIEVHNDIFQMIRTVAVKRIKDIRQQLVRYIFRRHCADRS